MLLAGRGITSKFGICGQPARALQASRAVCMLLAGRGITSKFGANLLAGALVPRGLQCCRAQPTVAKLSNSTLIAMCVVRPIILSDLLCSGHYAHAFLDNKYEKIR